MRCTRWRGNRCGSRGLTVCVCDEGCNAMCPDANSRDGQLSDTRGRAGRLDVAWRPSVCTHMRRAKDGPVPVGHGHVVTIVEAVRRGCRRTGRTSSVSVRAGRLVCAQAQRDPDPSERARAGGRWQLTSITALLSLLELLEQPEVARDCRVALMQERHEFQDGQEGDGPFKEAQRRARQEQASR